LQATGVKAMTKCNNSWFWYCFGIKTGE